MLFFWPFIFQRINPHLEALCDVEVDEGRYLIESHVVLLCVGLCLQRVNLALEGQVKTIPNQNLHKAAR